MFIFPILQTTFLSSKKRLIFGSQHVKLQHSHCRFTGENLSVKYMDIRHCDDFFFFKNNDVLILILIISRSTSCTQSYSF